MGKQLFYVTCEYGDETGPQTKSGYVMAESITAAREWAREKVGSYPGYVKTWTTTSAVTDSNDKDRFEFEQASDHWDHADPVDVEEEED